MLEKIKDRLCDEAAHWYKMWSSWLAVAWGAIVTIFYTYPHIMLEVVNAVPAEYRGKLSPLVFVLASGLPILSRLLKQRNVPKPGVSNG